MRILVMPLLSLRMPLCPASRKCVTHTLRRRAHGDMWGPTLSCRAVGGARVGGVPSRSPAVGKRSLRGL